MPPGPDPTPEQADATRAVVEAIQSLVAARLGRAFLPAALLFAWGAARVVRGAEPWVAVGAVLTSAAMLAHGQRTVQRLLHRERRWMSAAALASAIPPLYGLWIVGWLGLRAAATESGLVAVTSAIAYVGLGVWLLRCWLKLLEVERLARVMVQGPGNSGEAA
jgi:hypothetical protein